MDYYTKNRFKEYDDLTINELFERKKLLENEVLDTKQVINDKKISSEQRTETLEDLKFLREQIVYIEELLLEKKEKSK